MPRLRNAIRRTVLLLAMVFAVWDAPELFHNFREWRAAAPSDPAAAQFWRSAFYMDVLEIGIVLGMGIVLWFLLKPRKRNGAPGGPI